MVLCKSDATGNKVLTAVIESGTIDAFGYLKQDYLIVDSIGLTYDIYKEIGIEPYSVNQLLEKVKDDKKVWDIYANGFTQCVNQCEQPKSTAKVMRYKPKNISELTQFVAGIRPSFQSMYHTFESREHFEYGIKALDQLLQDEYCSSSFILYQESLMKVLEFAGFPMSDTYTIIKAISKKKDYIRVNDNLNKQSMIILKSLAIAKFDDVNVTYVYKPFCSNKVVFVDIFWVDFIYSV